ncbi:uncharacterized protein NDAI_0F01380 [Naumovozyma dairenensis CBS 421]|uniref:t-SNARE coiled-coil homology domain-containing protein n=1 Tax=Naumovozyma dairenensis (strain ATCC 10597 / BCRC 20456 / CBS 421 / NBRC 0211 / NRRL Y-12639) TaxID=1071378 RepID=G0WCE6_NAUDC|nr:hypothetical protein NDAI_0F01380 [Naumovozyma dairenensis CBS 421]CCD25457.1 hypothetical protein NDAI_0F01380 [Naumovozyma dairenensis CBS 421]
MSYNNDPFRDDSNPYDEESFEMNNNNNITSSNTQDHSSSSDFITFMNTINHINQKLNTYESLINQIDRYHNNLLIEVNGDNSINMRNELDNLVSQASDLQYQLKDEIKNSQRLGLNDINKQTQAENSRQKFLKLIQDYRIIDSNYKDENKQQAMRQYKIVQPDATAEEVENAINDVGGQQIFSQALLNANRRGEAKTALDEVQTRHQELLKLEKSMAELNQLFNDMEQLVLEQQEVIETIDQNVEAAQEDVEQGIGHTTKAVKSARTARKNKIRCYIICALIVAVVVVVVVVPSVVVNR